MLLEFMDIPRGKLHFDAPQFAFCTHFSWFGVVKNNHLGIEGLYLFYNHIPALISPNFLTFSVERPDDGTEQQKGRADLPMAIEEDDGRGFSGKTAFLDTDILCYHVALTPDSDATEVRASLLLPETDPRLSRCSRYDAQSRCLIIETRMPRTDNRDPDSDHALTICLAVPPAFRLVSVIADGREISDLASTEIETDGPLVIGFTASRDDFAGVEQTFVVGIGEGPSADKIKSRMPRAEAVSSESSSTASLDWLSRSLNDFTFDGIDQRHRPMYTNAAYQILANTKAPRGRIGRYSVFPSRGTHCAHYLWDTCFTSLGVARFNERLAEDFLIALCESQEEDGRIPRFACATWNCPDESHPPLIAWAAWRLHERFDKKELIGDIYDPLCRMVEWWFANRDEDGDGLVEYKNALESGWDDSPRFEKGRIAAIDLNAFLNREMRVIAEIASVLARGSESAKWKERAADHAKLINTRLFDREDGLFYDRLVDEDKLHKVLTPASFMPLWAEVDLSREVAHQMIARYLINPKHFFGARPFPVVAYSDRHFSPEKSWHGPVWPNIAWAMVEVLRMYGFERECEQAAERLVGMMSDGTETNELYSSATGRPLGTAGLCRGCAVFMDLAGDFSE